MTASTRAEVESAWRERLSRFAQSGQTVKAFAPREIDLTQLKLLLEGIEVLRPEGSPPGG